MLKNLSDIKLISDDSHFRIRLNGKSAVLLALTKSSISNPLETSTLVREAIQSLKHALPADIMVAVEHDEANFIRASLSNIRMALIEAVVLVLGVIYLFLRSAPATLVPLAAIPISLLGTLIILTAFGFSLNILTLLALVLAIGLVVDDAIVVLENIYRHREAGQSPLLAAKKGVKEIGFAIIAMTCTLASVYTPVAFLKGTSGQLFIEFAVTLAGAVLLSGIVALTFSPMLCAKILKYHSPRHASHSLYERLICFYENLLERSLRKPLYTLGVMVALLFAAWGIYKLLPQEIAPREDRGLMGIYIPPISGKDINALDHYTQKIETLVSTLPEKDKLITFIGSWGGNVVIPLKKWSKRKRTPAIIAEKLREKTQTMFSVDVHPWSWDTGLPGIDEAGNATGLSLVLQTIGSYKELFTVIEALRQELEKKKWFKDVGHDLHLNTSGYKLDINELRLSQAGLTPIQVSTSLQVYFEGLQNLFFQKDHVRYPITLESASLPWGLHEIYLTNTESQRISLGALMQMEPTALPKELHHYNQMRSATLTVTLTPGDDFQAAMKKLEGLKAQVLPPTVKTEWSGIAKVFNESSSMMLGLLLMGLILVYAILAMQFESFIDPLIIILTVPLACTGALLTLLLVGQSFNIYTQIGLITLIGLITKHGILLVEFANQQRASGKTLKDAVRISASLRLRPILMTTGAMVVGSIPLILSTGAGNEARRAIGYVLVGGLSLGTLFTLFIIPAAYMVVRSRNPLSDICHQLLRKKKG